MYFIVSDSRPRAAMCSRSLSVRCGGRTIFGTQIIKISPNFSIICPLRALLNSGWGGGKQNAKESQLNYSDRNLRQLITHGIIKTNNFTQFLFNFCPTLSSFDFTNVVLQAKINKKKTSQNDCKILANSLFA